MIEHGKFVAREVDHIGPCVFFSSKEQGEIMVISRIDGMAEYAPLLVAECIADALNNQVDYPDADEIETYAAIVQNGAFADIGEAVAKAFDLGVTMLELAHELRLVALGIAAHELMRVCAAHQREEEDLGPVDLQSYCENVVLQAQEARMTSSSSVETPIAELEIVCEWAGNQEV